VLTLQACMVCCTGTLPLLWGALPASTVRDLYGMCLYLYLYTTASFE
jgi:hypothetical protein